MDEFEGKHSELTGKIIDAYYTVYNALGYGFLEKLYERAMVVELSKQGLRVETQRPLPVYYCGVSWISPGRAISRGCIEQTHDNLPGPSKAAGIRRGCCECRNTAA